MSSKLTIDGSFGEGGGQVLRSSLALSLITEKPFEIHHIRANRKKPGLMPQHLTAVNAAVAIGKADISGNAISSTRISFAPTSIHPGNYHFNIGTAGSCTLVLQAILPALILADKPSTITLEGGTHNPFAPPYDFMKKAFLPLICKMGPDISMNLIRSGFYPAGGGIIEINIRPSKQLKPISLIDRGEILEKKAIAMVAHLPQSIAKRELKTIAQQLQLLDDQLQIQQITNSKGPGNVVSLLIRSENCSEVFTAFGKKRVRAEKVASNVSRATLSYVSSSAAVGKHLADQLLIFMAMAGGGQFTTLPLTQHTLTNIEIIKQFIDVDFNVQQPSDQSLLHTITILNNSQ